MSVFISLMSLPGTPGRPHPHTQHSCCSFKHSQLPLPVSNLACGEKRLPSQGPRLQLGLEVQLLTTECLVILSLSSLPTYQHNPPDVPPKAEKMAEATMGQRRPFASSGPLLHPALT